MLCACLAPPCHLARCPAFRQSEGLAADAVGRQAFLFGIVKRQLSPVCYMTLYHDVMSCHVINTFSSITHFESEIIYNLPVTCCGFLKFIYVYFHADANAPMTPPLTQHALKHVFEARFNKVHES